MIKYSALKFHPLSGFPGFDDFVLGFSSPLLLMSNLEACRGGLGSTTASKGADVRGALLLVALEI